MSAAGVEVRAWTGLGIEMRVKVLPLSVLDRRLVKTGWVGLF